MKKLFLLIIITSALFTACSSQRFYSVEPAENSYEYYEGRMVLSQTIEEVDVFMNFEYQDRDHFVFYLFAVNNSDERVMIDPDKIKSVQSGKSFADLQVIPLNPEKEIEMLQNKREELEDSHAANVGMNCIFATFNIVADLADGEEEAALDDAGYWAEEMEYEQDTYEFNSAELARSKSFWENEALRITTLYPGEEVGGLIFLPIQPEAGKIKIVFELENSELEFRFRQIAE